MVKRGRKTNYRLWIEPEVHSARESLPGNIRQRVRRLLDELAAEPRPSSSKALDVSELDVLEAIEIRRVRLEHWRVLYAINDQEGWVWRSEFIEDRHISMKIYRNLFQNFRNDGGVRSYAAFVYPQDSRKKTCGTAALRL